MEKEKIVEIKKEAQEQNTKENNEETKKEEWAKEQIRDLCKSDIETCKEGCTNDTLTIGTKCGKLHMELVKIEKIQKQAEEERKTNKENTRKKMKAEYCKNNMYGRCTFGGNCKRAHITLDDYKRTIKCKYFERGYCEMKNRCKFKHERNTQCTFYEKGKCAKGEWCIYKHIDPVENTAIETKKKASDNITVTQKENEPTVKQEQNFQINKNFLEQIELIIEKVVKRELRKMEN